MGVRGIGLKWFKSYLECRRQRVRIDEFCSDYETISYGVPQGSVLGPSLFLAYINDLYSLNLPCSQIFSFADDTVIVFYGKSWNEVRKQAENGLRRVGVWLQKNLLTLNASKTKILPFRISNRSAPPSSFQILLHSCDKNDNECLTCPKLLVADDIKYLGIVVDCELKWIKQISALSSKVRKLIHIFRQLREVADRSTIKLVYTSLCQPLLSYGIISWGAADKTHLIKIERAQRALIKVAYKKPFRFSTDALYAETQLLRVRHLFVQAITLRFHRVAKKLVIYSNRRVKWDLPVTRTIFARKCFGFLGPYIYGKVNKEINIIELSRARCRKNLRSWMTSLNYEDGEKLLQPQY